VKKLLHTRFIILTGVLIFLGCSKGEGTQSSDNDDTGSTERTTDPKISSVDHASASAGDTIIISGANLGDKASTVSVSFNHKEAKVIFVSEAKVKVIVPSKGEKDWANLVVNVSGDASNPYIFTYKKEDSGLIPIIDSLSINAAKAGSDVEIVGSGFGEDKDMVTATFDGNPVAINFLSDQKIKVKVPLYQNNKKVIVAVEVKDKESNKVYFYYKNVPYTNPVSNTSLPDPTVIMGKDGYFYLYATEDTRGMPIMQSKDLTAWKWTNKTVFNNATRPTWLKNGGLWAPGINYINNRYVLYYALSTWGEAHDNGIGIATADGPQGPFTDKGKLFTSDEIGVSNSIDPDLLVDDNGKNYLFWGSMGGGLYMIEMSSDGLSIKQGAKKQKVAGDYIEGVYVYKRENYYYLFGSVGTCCAGASSTYQLVVGRSSDLTGPYLNKSGHRMLDGYYSDVISGSTIFKGTGHCSPIVKDDAGDDWILFHGYDTRKTGDQADWRFLLLERVYWDNDGWPYIGNNGTPSTTEAGPVFKE
jgi:arabinan endo-1,5-alpha-L-arabinosidase